MKNTYIKELLLISKVTSLLPFNVDKKGNISRVNKCYSIFVMALLLTVQSINIYYRCKLVYHEVLILIDIVDILLHVYSTLNCSNFIIQSIFLNENNWRILKEDLRIETLGINFYLLNFIFSLYMFFETLQYFQYYPVIIFLPDILHSYLVLASTLNINTFLNAINRHVKKLRNKIENDTISLINYNIMIRRTSVSNIKNSLYECITLFRIIDTFNEVYGVQILGIAGAILLFVTDNVKLIIFSSRDFYDCSEEEFIQIIKIIFVKFLKGCQYIVIMYLIFTYLNIIFFLFSDIWNINCVTLFSDN